MSIEYKAGTTHAVFCTVIWAKTRSPFRKKWKVYIDIFLYILDTLQALVEKLHQTLHEKLQVWFMPKGWYTQADNCSIYLFRDDWNDKLSRLPCVYALYANDLAIVWLTLRAGQSEDIVKDSTHHLSVCTHYKDNCVQFSTQKISSWTIYKIKRSKFIFQSSGRLHCVYALYLFSRSSREIG